MSDRGKQEQQATGESGPAFNFTSSLSLEEMYTNPVIIIILWKELIFLQSYNIIIQLNFLPSLPPSLPPLSSPLLPSLGTPSRQQQAAFAAERNWDQYHTPRNILLALVRGNIWCCCRITLSPASLFVFWGRRGWGALRDLVSLAHFETRVLDLAILHMLSFLLANGKGR